MNPPPSFSQPSGEILRPLFGTGLPPVSNKLVKRIQEGQFIEIAELLPEQLAASTVDEDQTKSSKSKSKAIFNILDWVQSFSLHTAIILQKQPGWVPDLIGYQALIIDAHQEFQDEGWIGYDRRFGQRVAIAPIEKWANVDTTLWNLAFGGRHCKLCLSASHATNDCELAGDHVSHQGLVILHLPTYLHTHLEHMLFPGIIQMGDVTFVLPGMRPQPQTVLAATAHMNIYVCYFCYCDPTIANKSHKAMFCPNWQPGNSQRANARS